MNKDVNWFSWNIEIRGLRAAISIGCVVQFNIDSNKWSNCEGTQGRLIGKLSTVVVAITSIALVHDSE